MKLEHWHALLATHREVRESLDRTLPLPASGEQRTFTRVGMDAMLQLQQRFLGALNPLREALVNGHTSEQVEEILQPYVFLLDELVLRRLSQAEQPLWPLIQQRLFGQDSGGDHFFDLAEARLSQADTPVIQLEMLYFCLLAGFQGRHSDNAAKLQEFRERLKARIPRPLPPGAPEAAPPVEPMPIYEFPLRYYLATGLVVALLPVVLWWLSNT
jgi:type VI secretion system protein ImpK